MNSDSRLLLALRCGLAAFLVFILTRTWADPDLWGHVLFGRDIVVARALPSVDPYSFTTDTPWINHEWLAEVLMYVAYAWGGSFGLIVLKTTLMVVAGTAVLLALRPANLSPSVHDLLVFLFVAGTFPRAHAFRPQVFSIVLFALLLIILRAAEQGRWRALLFVPAVFVLWVNLHGGWLVGLGVFGFWSASKLFRSYRDAAGRRWLVTAGIATLAATFVNPYGWHLWDFLAETVRFEREAIADWQPLWRLSLFPILLWTGVAALAAFALVARRREMNWSFATIVALCGAGSLLVSRLDMFFLLATLILIGPSLAVARTRRPAVFTRGAPVLLASVVVATVAVVGAVPRFSCVQMYATWHPEPDVVELVADRNLRGRMLTFFDWGEYAIWHLAPAMKVSIDGRRETIYSERIIADHLRVYRNEPSAVETVATIDPDFVWLPSGYGIIDRLDALGWSPLFEGPVSTLLAAPGVAARSPLTASEIGSSRCFPDR